MSEGWGGQWESGQVITSTWVWAGDEVGRISVESCLKSAIAVLEKVWEG